MTHPVIDIDALLNPISVEEPTGQDLRSGCDGYELYCSIKDARAAARSAERQALFADENDVSAAEHWQSILQSAPKLLTTYSKDLEVTAWYIEALLREYGFPGLREGFSLANELITQYWEDLYPMPDEEGIETKVAAFIGLNGESSEGTLIQPLRLRAITEETDQGQFDFSQYLQSLQINKIADEEKRQNRINETGLSLESVQSAVAATSCGFYNDLNQDLQACIEQFQQLSDQLYRHCGHEAPPSSTIRNTLEEIQSALKFLLQGRSLQAPTDTKVSIKSQPDDDSLGSIGQTEHSSTSSNRLGFDGSIGDRQVALAQLSAIADFFRRTEPHSPLSSAVDRAVRWGNMTLEELMLELLPESSARNTFAQLTGAQLIQREEGESSQTENNSTSSEGVW